MSLHGKDAVLSLRLPASTVASLRALADATGRTVSEVCREAMKRGAGRGTQKPELTACATGGLLTVAIYGDHYHFGSRTAGHVANVEWAA